MQFKLFAFIGTDSLWLSVLFLFNIGILVSWKWTLIIFDLDLL